jgi:hypothetical protein
VATKTDADARDALLTYQPAIDQRRTASEKAKGEASAQTAASIGFALI